MHQPGSQEGTDGALRAAGLGISEGTIGWGVGSSLREPDQGQGSPGTSTCTEQFPPKSLSSHPVTSNRCFP